MIIPSEYFLYINIGICLIYLIACIIAFKNGLLLQAVSLVYTFLAIIISWFLAPILASSFPIIKVDSMYSAFNLEPIINSLVYCVIIFIVLKIIYWFIAPLLKFISDIPVIGSLNKVGGIIIGLINATIIVLVLSLILNTSVFKNGEEVRQNTLFKYGDSITSEAMKLTVKYINLDALKDSIENFDVDDTRQNLTNWLKEIGIINE